MSTKDKILSNLNEITSQDVMNEILEFIQKIKVSFTSSEEANKAEFMSFAGILTEQEGDEMQILINQEFSHIEGNWE